MHISFRASNDGQSLEVKSVSYEHNHKVNKVYIHRCTNLAPDLQIAANFTWLVMDIKSLTSTDDRNWNGYISSLWD